MPTYIAHIKDDCIQTVRQPLSDDSMPLYIAHIKDDRIQTVRQHLSGVATLCEGFSRPFGMGSCGALAGWIHDSAKLSDAFQSYIVMENPGHKGPDHSTAGGIWLLERREHPTQMEELTAQIIALACMGHHGGLMDVFSDTVPSPYTKRIRKRVEDATYGAQYRQSMERFSEIADSSDLDDLFEKGVVEVTALCRTMRANGHSMGWSAGLLCRFLSSALIDADRLDTACFIDNIPHPRAPERQEVWEELCQRLECALDSFPPPTGINVMRSEISKSCLTASSRGGGVYTLNAPTGSGKTYAALRFALHHAKENHRDHIFFFVPYLTILEQNAKEIREILGDSPDDPDSWLSRQVLEIHSAKESDAAASPVQLEEADLLAQRFDAPIIFTSMVRFLNTIFHSGTKNIRALHQFCNSILIFDEIQTLSLQHIGLFNQVVHFLVHLCNATVVLSTATQPGLDGKFESILPLTLSPNPELSGCHPAMREGFRRTKMVSRAQAPMGVTPCAQMVWQQMEEHLDILVILNTKKAVRTLFDEVERLRPPGDTAALYLLSANLYPAHRKARIKEIRSRLDSGQRLIVISTQLIEAGVDVSFHTVIRSLAGLDSLVQGAGRCNRYGTFALGYVYLIHPDFEDLSRLPDIKAAKGVMMDLLRIYERTPDAFPDGLDGEAAISRYFHFFYKEKEEKLTYPVLSDGGIPLELYHLLGENRFLRGEAKANLGAEYQTHFLGQSFQLAAHKFKAIDDYGGSVVVSHGGAIPLIAQLFDADTIRDKGKILQKLQSYTVNLSEYQKETIGDGIYTHPTLGIDILDEGYYSEQFGVSTQQLAMPFLSY